ncbi:MAG: ABC transporter substrate-binding protein [Candidatus Peribacteria bacterium]|nr:ABC transporter substrate-binding protein [Candidatus Peribacteria bacterium]
MERFNATHTNVQVQLIVEDGKGEGKDATSAVNKLLDVDKVDVIYGGDTSSEALASAQITQKAKIINLVA